MQRRIDKLSRPAAKYFKRVLFGANSKVCEERVCTRACKDYLLSVLKLKHWQLTVMKLTFRERTPFHVLF